MNALIVATIAGGLFVDQWWGAYGQVLVSAFTWILLATLLGRTPAASRRALVACMAARAAIVAIRLAVARDELRQTRERLETFTHLS